MLNTAGSGEKHVLIFEIDVVDVIRLLLKIFYHVEIPNFSSLNVQNSQRFCHMKCTLNSVTGCFTSSAG